MSSFALEFRKKMQADAREVQAKTRKTRKAGPAKPRARARKIAAPAMASADFAMGPAKRSSDTAGNRRRMLAALLLAGLILSVFNSGALVRYAGGLGYNQAAMRVIIASENWHALMERSRMTALMDGVRETVMAARHSQWRDLAFGLDMTPTHPYLQEPKTAEKDAGAQAEVLQSADPMMRAAAGR